MNAVIGKAKADVQAGYNNKAFGANSFYTPKFPNQFEATSTIFASAGISDEYSQSWHASVYWRRHYDRFELFRDNAPSWYKTHNYHQSDVAGANANKTFIWKKHKTSLGADFRMEHIYSNVLGTTMTEPIAVAGTDSSFYTKSAQRNGFSIMAEHRYASKKFSVSGGALLYINDQLEHDFSVYPGIDLGYQISGALRIFGTANRSLRLPNFTNLYYSSPTNIGNPLLKPEEAISLESGFKWNKRNILAEITGFQRYGVNMIDWVRDDTATVWECKNLTKVNVSGIEAGFTMLPEFFGKTFFIQRFSVNYTFLVSDKSSEGFVSQYVLDYMKHKLDIKAVHRITENAGLSWQISWQDRAGGYTPFSEGVYLAEVPYQPVWLADAGVFYQWKNFRFTINCTNLFDTEIIDHANVSQPGFMLMGGISWKYGNQNTK
ncbi:Vitamin B12 transporter BtuB [bioreactor metagenome]|uniref:Vitamin B12 transporter BtuB n=1 Tax=bioreactor metagenome TaxID=1076179 RepID=A0A644XJ11_9ZZZZ